jgi:hypothetical protein
MIQTQLLRLDPPYQLISAGGQVGVQVATLIVTEDKQDDYRGYAIDTHSHPVVNYGLKQGLENELKYGGGHPDAEMMLSQRMQPEGAVWNKVEINDVRVLGLAGAENRPISLETFLYLVPWSARYQPYRYVWDDKSIAKMYDLIFGFNRVGLKCEKKEWLNYRPHENKKSMCLEINTSKDNTSFVHVVILGEDEYDPYFGTEVGFWFRLYDKDGDSIDACVKNIVYAFKFIKNYFIKGGVDEEFGYNLSEQNQELDDVLKQLTKCVNQELGR